MITIMTTTPITADLSGGVPPGGTKTAARETHKALRGILKQLGVSA